MSPKVISSVTLMIIGDSLDPGEVTKVLAMRPSQQWRRGDRQSFKRNDGTRKILDSMHEWGGWKKWSTARNQETELPALIDHWCRKLVSKKAALARIKKSGNEVILDCCLVGETSQFILPSPLLAKLASLGLDLRGTFYHHEEVPN